MRSRQGQRLTDAELAAWRGLLRVGVRLRRELGERLSERHQLTMAEYDALVQLAEQPGGRMRMAELADAILQPRSSLSRIADGLEHRGLIRRERTAEDARGAAAVLTRAGLATYRRAQRTHHDNIRAVFLNRLSDAQLTQLADAWASIDPEALAPAPDEPKSSADLAVRTRAASPRCP
jgi:DNA-binding MarR family transcriptional regulator